MLTIGESVHFMVVPDVQQSSSARLGEIAVAREITFERAASELYPPKSILQYS